MSKKFSDLPQLTTPHSTDKLLIDDAMAGATKYILGSDLMQLASNIPTATITAPMLATSAITLGYAQINVNITTTSTTYVQATGLSASATIPAGSRRIRITVYQPNLGASTGNAKSSIWDGTVGSGTQLNECISPGANATVICQAIVTPSAGSKTYNVGFLITGGGGTTTIGASSIAPAYIHVEAV
jgi:PKD repeat protein